MAQVQAFPSLSMKLKQVWCLLLHLNLYISNPISHQFLTKVKEGTPKLHTSAAFSMSMPLNLDEKGKIKAGTIAQIDIKIEAIVARNI